MCRPGRRLWFPEDATAESAGGRLAVVCDRRDERRRDEVPQPVENVRGKKRCAVVAATHHTEGRYRIREFCAGGVILSNYWESDLCKLATSNKVFFIKQAGQ